MSLPQLRQYRIPATFAQPAPADDQYAPACKETAVNLSIDV